jgi:hypothetical protein
MEKKEKRLAILERCTEPQLHDVNTRNSTMGPTSRKEFIDDLKVAIGHAERWFSVLTESGQLHGTHGTGVLLREVDELVRWIWSFFPYAPPHFACSPVHIFRSWWLRSVIPSQRSVWPLTEAETEVHVELVSLRADRQTRPSCGSFDYAVLLT